MQVALSFAYLRMSHGQLLPGGQKWGSRLLRLAIYPDRVHFYSSRYAASLPPSLPPTRYARGSDIFVFLPRVSLLRSSTRG